jgi:hypothetical protein
MNPLQEPGFTVMPDVVVLKIGVMADEHGLANVSRK